MLQNDSQGLHWQFEQRGTRIDAFTLVCAVERQRVKRPIASSVVVFLVVENRRNEIEKRTCMATTAKELFGRHHKLN